MQNLILVALLFTIAQFTQISFLNYYFLTNFLDHLTLLKIVKVIGGNLV